MLVHMGIQQNIATQTGYFSCHIRHTSKWGTGLSVTLYNTPRAWTIRSFFTYSVSMHLTCAAVCDVKIVKRESVRQTQYNVAKLT